MSETRTITVTGTLVSLGDHEQEDGDMAHGMFIALSIDAACEVGLSDLLLEDVRITMALNRGPVEVLSNVFATPANGDGK